MIPLFRYAAVLALLSAAPLAAQKVVPAPVPGECATVKAPSPGSDTAKLVSQPEARTLMIPPLDAPAAMRGKTFSIGLYINTRGVVDSIDTRAIPDAKFAKKVKDTYKNGTWTPAMLRGCPVPALARQTLTIK